MKINAQKGEIPSEDGVGLERAFGPSRDLGKKSGWAEHRCDIHLRQDFQRDASGMYTYLTK